MISNNSEHSTEAKQLITHHVEVNKHLFLNTVQQVVLTGSIWVILADQLVHCVIHTAFNLKTRECMNPLVS